ncbi:MAG: S1C family serine protease [Phycisphaerales bacterium]
MTTIVPGLILILAAAAALIAGPMALKQLQLAQVQSSIAVANATLDRGTILDQLNIETRAVSDAVMPGVVHIDVRYSAPESEEGQRRRFTRTSNGSGWFFDSEGHIVTNAHVVQGASRIRAQLSDGRVYTADLLGIDPYTDIAVLKVPAQGEVFPLRRASGEPVYVGDHVFAFGSPFGIRFSMSKGVISGLGRSEAASFVGMLQGYTNFIQTDAAINPGNSGGPLVDVNGRVVGMSAAIANNVSTTEGPQQGQSAGIGFAIPVDTIDAVVGQLLADEVIIRGYLGIQLTDAEFRSPPEYNGDGVLVTSVVPNQPASQAGLRRDDIITAIDGLEMPNSAVLRSTISVRVPGSTVVAQVWRDGEVMQVPVKIGGAYMTGAGNLIYIPNSQNLAPGEVRAWLRDNGE